MKAVADAGFRANETWRAGICLNLPAQLADEHAQRDMLAFRALDIFQLAQSDLDRFGSIGGIDRIAGIRAGLAGTIDERESAFLCDFKAQHDGGRLRVFARQGARRLRRSRACPGQMEAF